MGQCMWTALRLLVMCASVVGVFLLHRFTLGTGKPASVFDAVYANCIVTLMLLVYYCVLKFLYGSCCWMKKNSRRGATRNQVMMIPRSPDGRFYTDVQRVTTEVVWGVPRLTLQNVWILVYGVGFILFVSGYCILGVQPLCLACFGFAVGVLSVDELVCPRATFSKLYISARIGALLCCLVSLVLVTAQLLNQMLVDFVETLDLYALTFGLCLPFLAQFLMVAVRESRHYTIGSVIEVCEFGLPFAVFLSIFHLSVAYGQQYQLEGSTSRTNTSGILTFSRVFRTDTPFVAFFTVAPFLVAPSLVGYVTCALDGTAVDSLIAVTVALCVHFYLDGPASVIGIYGTVCCGVAFMIRVMIDYTPVIAAQPWNQASNSQLGQLRDRSKAAEDLTHVLAEDVDVMWQRGDEG